MSKSFVGVFLGVAGEFEGVDGVEIALLAAETGGHEALEVHSHADTGGVYRHKGRQATDSA